MGRKAAVAVFFIALGVVCAAAAAIARGGSRVGADAATPLSLTAAAVPRFPVRGYDTSGTIPRVRDDAKGLRAVNAAIRAAVIADQRGDERQARASVQNTGRDCRGVYRVWVERRLLSASSVVVSALLPAQKLYPCGNDGNSWVSLTIRVPSGKRVRLAQLFQDPQGDFDAVVAAWFRVIAHDWRLACVVKDLPNYQPRVGKYRYFALTPTGLALGFWQEPACNRIEGIVPYATLQPYLSTLGKQLVAGVRRPR